MSLGEHSLDQLARVRRLLQHFATPHPGVRLLTLDVEAHAAALEPELAVLDATPFGSLGEVDVSTEPTSDGASHQRRSVRGAPQVSEAARRQRRLEMLKPTRLAHEVNKQLSVAIAKQAPHQQANAAAPQSIKKTVPPEPSVSKTINAKAEPTGAPLPGRTENVSKHGDDDVPSKPTLNGGTATRGNESTQSDTRHVELGSLVQRVMQKRRQLRHRTHSNVRSNENEDVRPAALPVRARPNDATVIQPRPVPPAVSLPVSTRSKSGLTDNAIHVTQKHLRSHLNELTVTPAPNRTEHLEPARTRGATRPAFFFNALEQRESEEPEQALADRIDQVLREQARRQGVDLT